MNAEFLKLSRFFKGCGTSSFQIIDCLQTMEEKMTKFKNIGAMPLLILLKNSVVILFFEKFLIKK